ncbi:MAG: VWA domain-containing protein [Thermoanaerobaculia bacterium]|nr:VWA domain-containing protein [Thermoanaerobaculia bacterium]
MWSWMVTGPFNLSSARSGSLSFDLYLDTEEGFDAMSVGASIDGFNYTTFIRDTDTNGFERISFDLKNWGSLGDLTTRSSVWFAFIYETDSSVTFEGAYVDQIALNVDTGSGLNLLINQVDPGDCPTLRAFVSVTDGQGNPIQGLQGSAFTVNQNGSTQTFTSRPATGSGAALATTLVLDGSQSLGGSDIANMKTAAKAYIDLLQAVDPVAVYHFGTNIELIRDYTTNRANAKAAVDALTNSLGRTSLYDAIVEAANHSLAIGGRRALLVMTDGMDNDSSASEQQAIAAAISAGLPVFTIGFGSVDEDVLERIATQTGGLFFLGASSADLAAILARIGTTLGQQYVLSWPTAQVNGGSQTVTIGVNHQGQSATKTATFSQAGTACANGSACIEGPTTLCLNNGRFRVEVSYVDFAGGRGSGQVAPCGVDDSGLFWFFAPDNWELLVKVLNGCGVNNRYWVLGAATTNVGYTLNVTDTRTGARKTYTNRLGVVSPAVVDTDAFATCP